MIFWLAVFGIFSLTNGLGFAAPDGLARIGIEKLEAEGLELVDLEQADAVVVRSGSKVDEAWLDEYPKVKVIARAGVGVDNVDLAACERRGVAVASTPGASTASVAELTIAHILNAVKRLPEADRAVRSGDFVKFKQRRGQEIRGKTLGILGFGAIGQRVGDLARCLGMDVKVSRRPEDLFATSDVVSLHLPLTAATKDLVDLTVLAHGRGVHLVNAARGGIVVEPDVLTALDAGHLATYSTDVLEQEPPDLTNPLLHHPSVFLSPHIGAATHEAQDNASLGAADAILSLLLRRTPDDDDDTTWRLVVPPPSDS